ncbi:MAG TPA: hypothetical protein VGH36_07345 [Acetobacteraceae bacterium]
MGSFTRRRLLAAPAILLAPLDLARPAPRLARLRPERIGPVFVEPAAAGTTLFHADRIEGAVTLPSPDARLVALLPIAGREVACLAFAADPPWGKLSLMSIAGWDGVRLRLLGLEVLNLTGVDGALLSSRFAGVGDRTRLRIGREAARPRAALPRAWENWTDLLAWRDSAPLAAALVRPPLPGTWQAALRNRSDALLTTPRQAVPPEWIQAVWAAFSPAMPASPPMRDTSPPPAGSRR